MSSYRKVRLSIKPWRDHFLVVPPSLRCASSLFSITLFSLFFAIIFFIMLFFLLFILLGCGDRGFTLAMTFGNVKGSKK